VLRRVGLVVMLFGMTCAACGGTDDGSSSSGGDLRGTTWVLDQEASTLEAIAPEVKVTARFTDDRLSGSAGCNNYNTSYTIDGSNLTVGSAIATTRKFCPPPASNVEVAYLERLPQVRSFAVQGDRLTLTTTTRSADLVYRALNAQQALAGSWVATSYFRPGAVTSLLPGTTITATFADGRISGNGGCNEYGGPYTADGSTIRIGPIVSTKRACADPAANQQEADYFAALELAREFELRTDGLWLLREGGTIAVTYALA
jgi:heat shock protein HslJ